MNWDEVTLVIVASFGCVTLLLTQVNELLSKVPQTIRAWRQVRNELRGGGSRPCPHDHSAEAIDPGLPAVGLNGRGRTPGEAEQGRDEG
ncbi:hypothetical protein ACFXKJ_20385 [Kitasatospora indigofera]|uniref:hypothetical protein n=1 Tax=Kitasatospora indigofera TaxID=67307 RepID=UPI00364106D4